MNFITISDFHVILCASVVAACFSNPIVMHREITVAESMNLNIDADCMVQVLVPIPQYPLYSATIQLLGGTLVPYYLTEEENWGMSINELRRSVTEARRKGICVSFLSRVYELLMCVVVLSRRIFRKRTIHSMAVMFLGRYMDIEL